MKLRLLVVCTALGLAWSVAVLPGQGTAAGAGQKRSAARPSIPARELRALRLAVEDLTATFGSRYPHGDEYLARLADLEQGAGSGNKESVARFRRLRQEALLANPLLRDGKLLLVKRKPRRDKGYPRRRKGLEIGMPSNHECNSSLPRAGYDNEVALLAPIGPDGKLTTLYRPEDGGYVGEIDLHWNADRMLMTRSDTRSWKIWEIGVDGTGLRQVSRMPDDVDCMDACYLPNGKIVFGSTASYQSVPCWHGQRTVNNLYLSDADGKHVRQLCFDQDHDLHPCLLDTGQVLYNRWDYTGISHIFLRELMVMNPDGTGQRAIYGSNSWFPNSLYFARPIPSKPGRLISILSGYHGVHRMGQLVVIDTTRGWHETDGLVQRISGQGQQIVPLVRDVLVDGDWPKFLHPYPLSDKHFLVSGWMDGKSEWGIYLADVFDNVVPLRREPGYALLEPVPLAKKTRPPVVPDRVDLNRSDAVVYLHDVYSGPGLAGVPRGTARGLRVVAYNFGFRGLAGPDKIGRGGPWEAMRILGTVPLEEDGSAVFRVPANTPLAVQVLDAEGKAFQLMRSWFTAMPGEKVSCVGCHESPREAGSVRLAAAATVRPRELTPWYGPPRGFDFAREVQPVLDKHCVSCHDGSPDTPLDLRPEEQVEQIATWPIGHAYRLHPKMMADTGGRLTYTPAYDALLSYIRRVGVEDSVSLPVPGEYHADTSELIQLLRKGHRGVRLDREAWDRLVTWIDLNGPCHGTWGDVYPIPAGAGRRRNELRRLCGGPADDPETIAELPAIDTTPVEPEPLAQFAPVRLTGWPLGAEEARQRQAGQGPVSKSVELGGGISLKLVRIPAGRFVMGCGDGQPDEGPPRTVVVEKPFWIGRCEVTNEQFRLFAPDHDSGYYHKRLDRPDGKGLSLNDPRQPAVRVSWQRAGQFCRWLSARTGMQFALPSEAQWEYACRAGSGTALSFGPVEADFSPWANVADASFSQGLMKLSGRAFPEGATQMSGGVAHLVLEGAAQSDARFNDRAVVTAPAGSYRPNAWGLFDMHGNAAEWTASVYQPYDTPDGAAVASDARRVVRGGSFFDRPERCRSAMRLAYPSWQRVFNVGFRVVAQ